MDTSNSTSEALRPIWHMYSMQSLTAQILEMQKALNAMPNNTLAEVEAKLVLVKAQGKLIADFADQVKKYNTGNNTSEKIAA